MFDLGSGGAEDLRAWVDALGELGSAPDARGMLEQVEALERIKCAAAAAQARITSDFDDHRRDEHPMRSHPDASLGAEIGVARHQSPHCGRRKLGLARALVEDLPAAMAALAETSTNAARRSLPAGLAT